MTLLIRPLVDADLSRVAAIYNEIYPGGPFFTAEKLRESEAKFPRNLFREYFVAEAEGELVASSILTQDQFYSLPGWYFFNIWVRPAFRNRGIGGKLFARIESRFPEIKPKRLALGVSETAAESIRFLEQRGFSESHRNFESRHDLSSFRPEDYLSLEAKLKETGIHFYKLSELRDPDHRRRIYDLQIALERKIPGSEHWPAMSFENFWAKVERDMPGGEFFTVATKDGEYIGIHYGSRAPGSEWFMVRVTVIRPEFRQLGVATALKARGMAYAKEQGFPGVYTWNDSRNRPILALNEKFGFRRQPATIQYFRAY